LPRFAQRYRHEAGVTFGPTWVDDEQRRGGAVKDSVHLSDDTQDKLQACLNQTWAESDYLAAKDYYDACIVWWDSLTPDQQETAEAVLEMYSFEHPQASEKLAATLPAAPKCPL
jgi:hypothetical protein